MLCGKKLFVVTIIVLCSASPLSLMEYFLAHCVDFINLFGSLSLLFHTQKLKQQQASLLTGTALTANLRLHAQLNQEHNCG